MKAARQMFPTAASFKSISLILSQWAPHLETAPRKRQQS